MEKFKATERDLKTKQYSKEGLQAKEKLDPVEVAKQECSQWITHAVDRLNTQVDALEAESELLTAQQTKTKRGRNTGGLSAADQDRLDEINHILSRHKFHMTKLETMLRLFENESLSVDDVETVKESVEYYVESNQEPDFMEDEELYDHLDLLDEEVFGALDDHQHSQESLEEEEALAAATIGTTKESRKKSADASLEEIGSPGRGKRKDSKANITAAPVPTAPTPVITTAKKPTLPPPLPVAATPAPASPSLPSPGVSSAAGTTSTVTALKPAVPTQKYASAASAALTTDPLKKVSGAAVPDKVPKLPPPVKDQPMVQPTVSSAAAAGPSGSDAVATAAAKTPTISFSHIVAAGAKDEVPISGKSTTAMDGVSVMGQQTSPSQQPTPPLAFNRKFPSAFADLVSAYDAARAKTYGRGDEALRNQHLMQILHSSFYQCPDVSDGSKSQSPFANATDSATKMTAEKHKVPQDYPFPRLPLVPYASPSLLSRLDLSTLFTLFYYHPNTSLQLLASRELKKQSWRFHEVWGMWFQRWEEPREIREEYERGTYVYFDFEGTGGASGDEQQSGTSTGDQVGGWCQRKKVDFTFEYKYLEDESA